MTFKEFATAILAGKEIVYTDGKTLRLSSRGALELEEEDGDISFLDNHDFDLEGNDLREGRIKEKRLMVYESELDNLVEKLAKIKATDKLPLKDALTKTLKPMLKMD